MSAVLKHVVSEQFVDVFGADAFSGEGLDMATSCAAPAELTSAFTSCAAPAELTSAFT
ncbi:hypothetical protein ATI53_102747, partial [Salipiger aestuarii]